MSSERVGTRGALLVVAAATGVIAGALAGYGCSSAPKRTEPLPMPTAHRVPRIEAVPEPPVALQTEEPKAPVYEQRPELPSTEPDLRVRIAALRSATAAPRFTHPSGTLLLVNGAGQERTVRTPVELKSTPQGWVVTQGAGSSKPVAAQANGRGAIELRPPVGASAVVVFDGTEWPGPVRAVAVDEGPGAMDLVVDVPLERYLPGVLARELYKNWSPETFRAQAIAARSFAVCEHAQWTHMRHYDLIAGEASQAWAGLVKDTRARQAVQDTRGMVLVYDDLVVPAFYSSTCGGVPANAVDSLTRNPNYGIPPLLAGASQENSHRDCCRAAPRFRWEQTMPVNRVLAQLRKWSGDQLADQRVAKAKAKADAAASATAAAGSHTREPAAGALLMRSEETPPATELGGREASSTAAPAGSGTVLAEPATDAPLEQLAKVNGLQSVEVIAANQAGRPVRIRIVDTRGDVIEMRAEEFRRAVNYAREGEPTPKDRLNSSAFQAQVQGSTVKFKGQGFGHGVGMCQYGAEAMSQKGLSAEQILRTYYPSATVRKAY